MLIILEDWKIGPTEKAFNSRSFFQQELAEVLFGAPSLLNKTEKETNL
jgi:hypothetical protein